MVVAGEGGCASQARALGLSLRQGWAGVLAPALSSPLNLDKLLNSLSLSFLILVVGMGRQLLSSFFLEDELRKCW